MSSASIEISAESSDITDKKGSVVRTIYRGKTGTFTATNAWLHPQIMNAGSGSKVQYATTEAPIVMPMYATVKAGDTLDVTGAVEGSIKVIGLYGNGANSEHALTQSTEAELDKTFGFADNTVTVPAAAEGAPIQYFVTYDQAQTEGLKISNNANEFPDVVELKLFCSYVDPCSDALESCVVDIKRFQADPNMTISLDSENQEVDFNGAIRINFCDVDKELYSIYFPKTGKVITGVVDGQ